MNDFWSFKKMLTPVIIQIIFWISIVGVIFFAFYTMFSQFGNFWIGLVYLILGPIAVRVYCELLIVVFKINDQLNEIRKNTEK